MNLWILCDRTTARHRYVKKMNDSWVVDGQIILTRLAWLEDTVAKTWAARSGTDELENSRRRRKESVQVHLAIKWNGLFMFNKTRRPNHVYGQAKTWSLLPILPIRGKWQKLNISVCICTHTYISNLRFCSSKIKNINIGSLHWAGNHLKECLNHYCLTEGTRTAC